MNETLRALRPFVEQSVGHTGRALVDVRSPDEYSGKLLAPASLPQEGSQRDRNAQLRTTIRELAHQHRRYGYRRIYRLLRRRGQQVNKKRVQRLWQRAKLQVGRPRRKRRREA